MSDEASDDDCENNEHKCENATKILQDLLEI